IIPPSVATRLGQNFEYSATHLSVEEMQMEESAGLGMGLSILLLAILFYRWKHRSEARHSWSSFMRGPAALMWMVSGAALVSVLVFMSQAGLGCPARYLSPFYALLIVPILAGNGPLLRLCHKRWWRSAGMLVLLIAALPLILSPPRPL